jgi:hypothetical protein
MPRVVTATLDEAALRRVLTEFNASLTTIYLESETRIVLAPLTDFLGPKITLPPVRWLSGRAFGPTIEIRWQLQDDQLQAAALTENSKTPSDWQDSGWNALLDAAVRSRDVLLVGTNSLALPRDHILYKAQPQGGLWIETRIPRPLHYPVSDPKAERVVLRCIDYLARGLVVLTRAVELAAYKASQ